MSRRNDLLRIQQDIFDTFGVDKEEEFEVATYDKYITCAACDGTGMGHYDGSYCRVCRGKGHKLSSEQDRDWGS